MTSPRNTAQNQSCSSDAMRAPIARALDTRADALDAHVLSRLNQARHAALAAGSARSTHRWALALSGAAVACVCTLLWFGNQHTAPESWVEPSDSELIALFESLPETGTQARTETATSAIPESITAEFSALAASDDELELAESLAFYAWLDQAQTPRAPDRDS
jgi:hypothetical protein